MAGDTGIVRGWIIDVNIYLLKFPKKKKHYANINLFIYVNNKSIILMVPLIRHAVQYFC